MKLMKYCNVRQTLWYYKPNKVLTPEKFAHHVFILFYPYSDEKELLSGCPPLYQNKLQEKEVQAVINISKINFEPYADLVDQTSSQFNEDSISTQDPHSQNKNDETQGAKYSNENDSEDTKTNETSAIPNIMPKILPNDKITEGIYFLNSKQREVFDLVHTWAGLNIL